MTTLGETTRRYREPTGDDLRELDLSIERTEFELQQLRDRRAAILDGILAKPLHDRGLDRMLADIEALKADSGDDTVNYQLATGNYSYPPDSQGDSGGGLTISSGTSAGDRRRIDPDADGEQFEADFDGYER